MKRKVIDTLIIDGKRWSQKSYGNTYHSINITVNDVSREKDLK